MTNPKLAILKSLYIRGNKNPVYENLLLNYSQNSLKKIVVMEGYSNGEDYQSYCAHQSAQWADPDGDSINQRLFQECLNDSDPEVVIRLEINAHAKPQDVVRILNKMTKWITDEYPITYSNRLLKEIENFKGEAQNHKIEEAPQDYLKDEDLSNRDIFIRLLNDLQIQEEEDKKESKKEQDRTFKKTQESDIRTLQMLQKSLEYELEIEQCSPSLKQNDYPF